MAAAETLACCIPGKGKLEEVVEELVAAQRPLKPALRPWTHCCTRCILHQRQCASPVTMVTALSMEAPATLT